LGHSLAEGEADISVLTEKERREVLYEIKKLKITQVRYGYYDLNYVGFYEENYIPFSLKD
jgi:hypothetical protein